MITGCSYLVLRNRVATCSCAQLDLSASCVQKHQTHCRIDPSHDIQRNDRSHRRCLDGGRWQTFGNDLDFLDAKANVIETDGFFTPGRRRQYDKTPLPNCQKDWSFFDRAGAEGDLHVENRHIKPV
jgi:hypothetical protein